MKKLSLFTICIVVVAQQISLRQIQSNVAPPPQYAVPYVSNSAGTILGYDSTRIFWDPSGFRLNLSGALFTALAGGGTQVMTVNNSGVVGATAGNSILTPPITFTDISTPANPSAGTTKWYTKSGQMCALNPSGTETCTGTGGSGTTHQAALDCGISFTDTTHLSLFPSASSTNFCAFQNNNTLLTKITAPVTITQSGSGNPVLRIYLSDGSDGQTAGTVVICNSASSGIAESGAGAVVVNSCSAFPVSGGIFIHSQWTSTVAGLFDATGTLYRALMSSGAQLLAGGYTTVTPTTSGTTIGINTNLGIRTCTQIIGQDNGTALATADIQPQKSQCKIPYNATATEVDVLVDSGASTVNVGYRHNGSTTAISGVLTPATVSGITDNVACANTAGTAVTIEGHSVTCSVLTNTALTAGDWTETIGGAADGTTKRVSITTTWVIN